jgi:transcription initiation factor TFIID subunit 2
VVAAKPAPRVLPPVPKAFPTPPPTSAPVASTSRPTIKLKVGSQANIAETPQPALKPRIRKPKPSEPTSARTPPVDAPPPYVDDGSHDILQEVLAIEREKDEKRHRSTSEKEKDKPTAVNGTAKRKKVDTPVEEDEILSLATPAKKERPSPPGPSSAPTKIKVAVPPPAKPPVASLKAKKDKAFEPASSRAVSNDAPRMSIKGKEKEVELKVSSSSQSSKPKRLLGIPVNEKKGKDLLKALQKLPEAAIFARPVDPIMDGCPTWVLWSSCGFRFANEMPLVIWTKLRTLWISAQYQTSSLKGNIPQWKNSEEILSSCLVIVDNSTPPQHSQLHALMWSKGRLRKSGRRQ